MSKDDLSPRFLQTDKTLSDAVRRDDMSEYQCGNCGGKAHPLPGVCVAIFSTSDLRDYPEALDRAIAEGFDVRVATTRDTLCRSDDWWREKVDDLKIYMGQRPLLDHAWRRPPDNMHLVYGYRGWMRLYRELMGRDFEGCAIDVKWALWDEFHSGRDFSDKAREEQ